MFKRMTRAHPKRPQRFSSKYEGIFTMETQAKASDIGASTTNFLNQIGILQSNNEHAEVFLIQTVQNGAGASLNQSTRMVITKSEQIYATEELVRFKLTGDVFEPPVFTKT